MKIYLVILLMVLGVQCLAQEKFTITPGQSVHIVVLKSTGALDLATETKVREEFEKRKVFKIGKSENDADFSFMMVVEYQYYQIQVGVVGRGMEEIKAVTAFVLPKDMPDTGKKGDLDLIRESALWQYSKNATYWAYADLPKQITKKFHEDVKKK